MRALLWMIGGDRVPGGHRVQIEQTARHLSALDVSAKVSFEPEAAVGKFDIIHGFGLPPEQIRAVRLAGRPIVLSTIFCGRRFVTGTHIDPGVVERWCWRLRTAGLLAFYAMRGRHVEKCEALTARLERLRITYEMADLLLPNSEAEAVAIRSDLSVTTPCHVVPNAVEPDVFDQPGPPWQERSGVIYVGRFEPHKNQLALIRAMQGTGMPLTLVGAQHPDHAAYYAACKAAARVNSEVKLMDAVPHARLPGLFHRARVHALPSWFETTGLVSLEAALCGCAVVTTDRGYAREYFGDLAQYCDPASIASIREAVTAAHATPPPGALRQKILARYTWRHTALATRAAYERVLGRAAVVPSN